MAKYKSLQQKKILVVDDFPEFRNAIRRMVEAFGALDVDIAANGEEAISKIKETMYHVVLCDYNLGEGKDGQQVLEEGKHIGAINESQIFILLTAENSAEMVMGALEYEPDSYLIKPFTKEMVHERVMRCLEQKKELEPIYQALEGSDSQKALQILDDRIAKGGKLVLLCLKIKGKELLKLKRYDEAAQLYESILEARELAWAYMGLGKCYYYKEKYPEALQEFQKIIVDNDKTVEGYDWIARCYEKIGEFVKAQETLEQAVQMSSKAILRQQFLGRMALCNEDLKIAERAFKMAVSLGKHSVYRSDDDTKNYAYILLKRGLEETNARMRSRYITDALAALEVMRKFYHSNRAKQAEIYLIMVDIMLQAEKLDQVEATANKILGLLAHEPTSSDKELILQLANLFIKSGKDNLAEKGEKIQQKYTS